MEEPIWPGDGRVSFDVDDHLVLCSDMIPASTQGWEAGPTLLALMRSTRMMVRYCIEKWTDTYNLVLEWILDMTIKRSCKGESSHLDRFGILNWCRTCSYNLNTISIIDIQWENQPSRTVRIHSNKWSNAPTKFEPDSYKTQWERTLFSGEEGEVELYSWWHNHSQFKFASLSHWVVWDSGHLSECMNHLTHVGLNGFSHSSSFHMHQNGQLASELSILKLALIHHDHQNDLDPSFLVIPIYQGFSLMNQEICLCQVLFLIWF